MKHAISFWGIFCVTLFIQISHCAVDNAKETVVVNFVENTSSFELDLEGYDSPNGNLIWTYYGIFAKNDNIFSLNVDENSLFFKNTRDDGSSEQIDSLTLNLEKIYRSEEARRQKSFIVYTNTTVPPTSVFSAIIKVGEHNINTHVSTFLENAQFVTSTGTYYLQVLSYENQVYVWALQKLDPLDESLKRNIMDHSEKYSERQDIIYPRYFPDGCSTTRVVVRISLDLNYFFVQKYSSEIDAITAAIILLAGADDFFVSQLNIGFVVGTVTAWSTINVPIWNVNCSSLTLFDAMNVYNNWTFQQTTELYSAIRILIWSCPNYLGPVGLANVGGVCKDRIPSCGEPNGLCNTAVIKDTVQVFAHELGHLFGAEHTPFESDIMFPTAPTFLTPFHPVNEMNMCWNFYYNSLFLPSCLASGSFLLPPQQPQLQPRCFQYAADNVVFNCTTDYDCDGSGRIAGFCRNGICQLGVVVLKQNTVNPNCSVAANIPCYEASSITDYIQLLENEGCIIPNHACNAARGQILCQWSFKPPSYVLPPQDWCGRSYSDPQYGPSQPCHNVTRIDTCKDVCQMCTNNSSCTRISQLEEKIALLTQYVFTVSTVSTIEPCATACFECKKTCKKTYILRPSSIAFVGSPTRFNNTYWTQAIKSMFAPSTCFSDTMIQVSSILQAGVTFSLLTTFPQSYTNGTCNQCGNGIIESNLNEECDTPSTSTGTPGSTCCDNTCGLNKIYDACGICGGPGIPAGKCDCVGNVFDDCGVCNGNGASCLDCAGNPNGAATYDICDICNGDGTSCLDCAGNPNGAATYDICDICNGDGTCGRCGDGIVNGDEECDPEYEGIQPCCNRNTCKFYRASENFVCRPTAGGCDVEDTCTGMSTECPFDAAKPIGTVCRVAGGICGLEEVCDGSSTQCPENKRVAAGTTCRASVGDCDPAETCTGLQDTCPPDSLSPAGSTCRASQGLCDTEETCDGFSVDCPFDAIASNGTPCRPGMGVCDISEYCDGTNKQCPLDHLALGNIQCRPSQGDCDVAEFCSGNSVDCPSDGLVASGSTCRASLGECDSAEKCTGISPECPTDGFLDSSVVCRTAFGICDVEETCTGTGPSCPYNAFLPNGIECRASEGPCDVAEKCTGTGPNCPANSFIAAGIQCRAADGACDETDKCTGNSAECVDIVSSTSVICIGVDGYCTLNTKCDGVNKQCPPVVVAPNGTICEESTSICAFPSLCDGNTTVCAPIVRIPGCIECVHPLSYWKARPNLKNNHKDAGDGSTGDDDDDGLAFVTDPVYICGLTYNQLLSMPLPKGKNRNAWLELAQEYIATDLNIPGSYPLIEPTSNYALLLLELRCTTNGVLPMVKADSALGIEMLNVASVLRTFNTGVFPQGPRPCIIKSSLSGGDHFSRSVEDTETDDFAFDSAQW